MAKARPASKVPAKAQVARSKVKGATAVQAAVAGPIIAAGDDGEAASLERHLGQAIREQRQKNHLTIADVAGLASISRGMLSRIENGQTATSLDALSRIARALGISMSSLFRGYDAPVGGAQWIKAGSGMEVVRRGTKQGHTYHLLAYGQGPKKHFEPFLISMDDESETFPTFEHPGIEFIYMLEGRIEYRHGRHTYQLSPGDALTFRGEVPHGPERLLKLPIRFLSVIYYPDSGSAEE